MKTLMHRFESLRGSNTPELLACVQREVAGLGFERMLFAMLPASNATIERAFIFSNYPAAWRRRYDEQRLARIDPTVIHSLRRRAPLVWRASTFVGAPQRTLYEEAESHGLGAGVTLPVHDGRGASGLLTCVAPDTSRASERLIQTRLGELAILRDLALDVLAGADEAEAAEVAEVARPPEAPVRLSQRERDCLGWYATGKTSWEIARILSLSESGVNFHFCNIRRKFQVTRRHEAVLKAVSMGLIAAA